MINNITDKEVLEAIEKHKLHISPGINNMGWLVSRYGEEFELKYEPEWNSTKQITYRKTHPGCGTCGETLTEAIRNILALIEKVDNEK